MRVCMIAALVNTLHLSVAESLMEVRRVLEPLAG